MCPYTISHWPSMLRHRYETAPSLRLVAAVLAITISRRKVALSSAYSALSTETYCPSYLRILSESMPWWRVAWPLSKAAA